jgi:hypothetical protein
MARGAPPSTPYTSDVEETKTCVIYVLGNNKRIQIKDSKNKRGGSPKELRPRNTPAWVFNRTLQITYNSRRKGETLGTWWGEREPKDARGARN